MKRKGITFLFMVLGLVFCLSPAVFAQQTDPAMSGNWWMIGTPMQGDQSLSSSEYPAIQTIQGTVVSVDDMRGVRGSEQMKVKTPQGDLWTVFLGPRWFVDNQRVKFNPGDQVEVRGAKFLGRGTPGETAIVAADVSKGDMTMKLRNDSGLPSWECCFPRRPAGR